MGKWRQKIYLPTQEIYFPDESWKKINFQHFIPCLPNMKFVETDHFCQGIMSLLAEKKKGLYNAI